jgi:hypothetical protein
MTVVAVVPTTPRIQINLDSVGVLSGIFDVYISKENAVGANTYTRTASLMNSLFNSGSSDWDQIAEILKYSGINPPSYEGWLNDTPKDVALKAVIKWIREVLIPKLAALINGNVATAGTTAPVSTTPFANTTQFMEAIVGSIKWSVGADGKVTGTV